MDSRPGCPLPLQVEVASFHVAAEPHKWEDHGESAKYALYTINVAIPILNADWTVSRRFSDFTILRAYLASLYVAIGPLPSKTLLRNLSEAHLEARRKRLNEWLNLLCGRRDVLASQTLHHFLGVDVHCKNVYARLYRSSMPKQPILSGEDEENLNQRLMRQVHPKLLGTHTDANFGFRDAIFLKERRLLLTITTDFSIASRVDTLVSSTLSVLAEASIPLSSFGIHKMILNDPIGEESKALGAGRAQCTPCTGSSEDAKWLGVCGDANFRGSRMPIETETLLVHYFSRRATAMAVSLEEDIAFVGFESGSMAAYRHRDSAHHSQPCTGDMTDSDQEVDFSRAFHQADGRHHNRPTNSHLPDLFSPSARDNSLGQPGFQREDQYFPLLPQVAGSVRFLEIVGRAEDQESPFLLLCGGDDKQIQFYDLKRRQPQPAMTLTFPGNPRCVSVHPNGRTLVIGFDDESVALIGLKGYDAPRLLARGTSQRVFTRQGRGEASDSTNRVVFVSFLDLPSDRAALWSRIPASSMLDPNCESIVISGLKDGSVALWGIKTRGEVVSLKLTGRISRPCADTLQGGVIAPDECTLVIATKQGVVTALCPFDGQPLLSFAAHWRSSTMSNFKQGSGHAEGITSMRWFSRRPGETILLSGSRDGSVNFWSWPAALQ